MSEEEDSYEERAALVGARVRVALADGTVTRGLLVGVDPETLHVAVAQAVDGISGDSSRVRLKILLSHHVRGVARDEDEAADDVLVALLLGHAGLEADSHKSQHCIEDEETVTGRAARLAAFLERVRMSRVLGRSAPPTTDLGDVCDPASTLCPTR